MAKMEKGTRCSVSAPPNVSNERKAYSQDQIYGMMIGLALVVKCLPAGVNYNGNAFMDGVVHFRQEARNILHRMMTRVQEDNWLLKKPDRTTILEKDHGLMIPFSYGTARAAGKIMGDENKYMDIVSIAGYESWQYMQRAGSSLTVCDYFTNWDLCDDIYNIGMMLTLAALGDSWVGPNPFFLSVTDLKILELSDYYNWGSHYSLLWEIINDKTSEFPTTTTISQLNSAPCSGPFRHTETDFAPGGWADENRFKGNIAAQNGNGQNNTGNFSGLDYMLLHNMFYIKNPTGLPVYQSLMDQIIEKDFPLATEASAKGSHASPILFNKFRSIQYDGTLGADADVTMHAGESITLLPGFNSELGATGYFYAEPFRCVSGEYRKVENIENSTSSNNLYGFSNLAPIKDKYIPQTKLIEPAELPLHRPNNKYYSTTSDLEKITKNTDDQTTEFSIFPNPSNGNFIITNAGSNPATLTITNIIGHTIMEKQITSTKNPINLSNQSKGLYTIRITDSQGVKIKQILVQ